MKVLWLCGVPQEVQTVALDGKNVGAYAAWSWVMGHLPPPEGVELHIACPAKNISAPLEVEYRGVTFHLFPYVRGAAYTFFQTWLPGFRRVYEKISPDWVQGWGTEAGFSSAALRLTPNRSIVEIQGILSDYYPHMQKSLMLWFSILNERITLRKAPRLLAESEYSAQETKKYTRGGVGVIPHPLRDDFLQIDAGQKKKPQIVFLGALTDRKGIKDAVRAFAGASSNDWNLICIGRGKIEYEQEVRDLIRELGVEARVKMCGTLNPVEIIKLFQESPVFLLPTYMDTGPTALKEALSMGLWPVCYNNSGPQELIGHYQYGSLAPTGDIPALTESLRNVLAGRPWDGPGRMKQCIGQVRHDLSRETVWAQLMACYTDKYWESAANATH
ncbi:MAG: glycosyltransferase [Kiritimatiellaceae bacterium]|nr:glycosyltransferase [Kiritimatiellaceae bacterium]